MLYDVVLYDILWWHFVCLWSKLFYSQN